MNSNIYLVVIKTYMMKRPDIKSFSKKSDAESCLRDYIDETATKYRWSGSRNDYYSGIDQYAYIMQSSVTTSKIVYESAPLSLSNVVRDEYSIEVL
jgi:hypothetical protein